MKKLELCRELINEAGGIAGTMTTTVGQTGEFADVVRWIEKAYEYIQTLHNNWQFLRFNFAFQTIIGTQTYTPASANATDHANWRITDADSFRIYTGSGTDETFLIYIPWEEFRTVYLFGGNKGATGRPVYYTVQPNLSITLWPTPAAVYTVAGEYFKKPQLLAAVGNTSADDSVPVFPDRFHRLIVWKALQYYAMDQSSPEHMSTAVAEFRDMILKLRLDQLPPIEPDEPLA